MSDDLDRYLDDFGRTLERVSAAGAPVPRPRRRLALAGGATVASAFAVALLAVLLLPAADERLDPLAQARAALAPAGELIHTVSELTLHREDERGRVLPVRPVDRLQLEQWSTADPMRWRLVTIGSFGRTELAYADGSQRAYDRERNRLHVTRGVRPVDRAALAPGAGQLGTDPVLALRDLLAEGKLRDAGLTTVDGREVRRLVGEERFVTKRVKLVIRAEYHVDPRTSAPIRLRISSGEPGREQHGFTETRFTTYERLPLTAETARTLRIATKPDPTIVVSQARRGLPAPAPARGPRKR